jgi:hypothetical protein
MKYNKKNTGQWDKRAGTRMLRQDSWDRKAWAAQLNRTAGENGAGTGRTRREDRMART